MSVRCGYPSCQTIHQPSRSMVVHRIALGLLDLDETLQGISATAPPKLRVVHSQGAN